jgi:hypothetical protein
MAASAGEFVFKVGDKGEALYFVETGESVGG